LKAQAMTLKMQAAVVAQFGAPLSLETRDAPTPGAGQILVKTEACGVCHTDLHAANGDWPVKPALPFIPGHEAIGLVVALGEGVTAVKLGDRVGVPWLYSACGHCEHCLSAWETVCGEAKFGGYTQNGGFAEYLLADPDYVARIPDGLSASQAAPIICAGVTCYKGLKETGAKPGDWVAISGAGGLGHLAIQYANAMGFKVCAIDIDDGKLAHAMRLGAELAFNAKADHVIDVMRAATGGGAHGVLITAPSLSAFHQGVAMTRKRGTCVLGGRNEEQQCHEDHDRRASFRCRSSMSSPTASPSGARSSEPGRTWPRRWRSRRPVRSRPISNCSRSRRSMMSWPAFSAATWRRASCWNSLRAPGMTQIKAPAYRRSIIAPAGVLTMRSLGVMGVAVLLFATAAEAAPDPNAVVGGRRIAERFCGSCHAVARGPSPLRDAPPFRDLHNRYRNGGLSQLLNEGMLQPSRMPEEGSPRRHPRMPMAALEEDQVKDLTAYLRSVQPARSPASRRKPPAH
jgi:propanol-preferring alcohol dehydrogenase